MCFFFFFNRRIGQVVLAVLKQPFARVYDIVNTHADNLEIPKRLRFRLWKSRLTLLYDIIYLFHKQYCIL